MEKSSPPHFLTSLLSDSTFYNGNKKSSLPHFLTSLLSDSTFHNGRVKVESTSLSHFTSLRLDFSQRQWKSRVYSTFPLPWKSRVYTRLFHCRCEKSSRREVKWESEVDSTFTLPLWKVESERSEVRKWGRLDFSTAVVKSRVYTRVFRLDTRLFRLDTRYSMFSTPRLIYIYTEKYCENKHNVKCENHYYNYIVCWHKLSTLRVPR